MSARDELSTTASGGSRKAARGWLLGMPGNRFVAIGERELVHVLPEAPPLYPVPRAPRHARHAMVWQERVLPVIEIGALQAPLSPGQVSKSSRVGVVAFRGDVRGTIGLGALLFHGVPRRTETADLQAHELPADAGHLTAWSISCLEDPEHGAVPVLDLSRLFAGVPAGASGQT